MTEEWTMTEVQEPRKYRVSYWRYLGRRLEAERVVELLAYDAKDAAEQARIADAAVYSGSGEYSCSVRSVEPIHDSSEKRITK